jgi:hypothetical protein
LTDAEIYGKIFNDVFAKFRVGDKTIFVEFPLQSSEPVSAQGHGSF